MSSYRDRLRSARKLRGLTQDKLAEVSGVPQGSISKIERGGQKTTAYTVMLCQALNINPVWLETDEGEMEIHNDIVFDEFLTECYLYTIKNTKPYNPSINQITVIAQALYNDGARDKKINLSVFETLAQLLV